MSYVIFKPATWRIFTFPTGSQAVYDSERQAKAQFTKLVNAGTIKADEWKIEPYTVYSETEPMVTVKSLMNGADVQIRMSLRGGCCDPSMERYWSM